MGFLRQLLINRFLKQLHTVVFRSYPTGEKFAFVVIFNGRLIQILCCYEYLQQLHSVSDRTNKLQCLFIAIKELEYGDIF